MAGVIVYYQCEDGCPDLREQLAEVVQPFISAGRHVLMMPNDPTWTAFGSQAAHKDMESRIALTAWQRLDKFDEFDAQRVRAFHRTVRGNRPPCQVVVQLLLFRQPL